MKKIIYIVLFFSLISCKVLKSDDFVGNYKTVHIYDVQDEITLFTNNKFEYKWFAGLAGNGTTTGIWDIKKNRLFLTSSEVEEPIRISIVKQSQKSNFKLYQFIIKDEYDDELPYCNCIAKYKGKVLSTQVSDNNGVCSFSDLDIDEIQIFFVDKEDFILKENFDYGIYEVVLKDKKPFKLVFDKEKVKVKNEKLKIKNKIFYKNTVSN